MTPPVGGIVWRLGVQYDASMSKNSTQQILERLHEMDWRLCDDGGGGLYVSAFARKWNVLKKTVKRDLAAFRKLGHSTEVRMLEVEEGIVEQYHVYKPGIEPRFLETRQRLAEAKRAREE
jgi:hypothetical protein